MNGKETFESTYRRYPFPALLELGLALSRLYVRARRARRERDERRDHAAHTAA